MKIQYIHNTCHRFTPTNITTPSATRSPTPPIQHHPYSTVYGNYISLNNDITKIYLYGIKIHGILPNKKYAEG